MTAPARTQVAKRDTQNSAVASGNAQAAQLRDGLAKYTESFARVLPKHLTPERLMTLALVAAVKTPKLYDCSAESIALAVIRVAQWGLEIGTTAHLVPFNNKIKERDGSERWVTTCTPIADWKGLIQMIERSGTARDVKARCVYAKENFRYTAGDSERIEHDPIWDAAARGPLVGVYASAKIKFGGYTFEVMGRDEVERIRQNAKSKDSDAWRNHYDEMAKKTVIRRLAKRLPQSASMAEALANEETYESAIAHPYAHVTATIDRPQQLGAGEVVSIDRDVSPPPAAADGELGLNDAKPEPRTGIPD